MKCTGCGRKLPKGRGAEGELVLCPGCAAQAAARGQGVDEDLANAATLEATNSPGAGIFLARFIARKATNYAAEKLAELISSPPKTRRRRRLRKSAT